MPQPERSFLLHERFWGQGYAQLSALNPYRWCGLAYAVFHSLTKSQFNRVPLAAGLTFHPLQHLLSQPEVSH